MTKSSACASISNSTTKGDCLERGLVHVKQVVIGPRLRRAGIIIFDECAGFSIFVGSTATTAPIITLVREGCGLGFHWAVAAAFVTGQRAPWSSSR